MDLTVRVVSDLSSVDPAAWDALDHGPSPFLEHGFLHALEATGSIGADSGWDPFYVLVEASPPVTNSARNALPVLLGAVPCFRKDHSYGEYIFDFGWARASMRAGLPYFPKLVVAAPVTPATGRRILLRPRPSDPSGEAWPDPDEVADLLIGAVRELADALACQSIHWLFTTEDEQRRLEAVGFLSRLSFQFHWQNHGYENFDGFTAALSSRKRKQIRKERSRARAELDGIEFIAGPDLQPNDLQALDRFYRRTTGRHGGQDYLRPGFFAALHRHLPHRIQFARARRHGHCVAGALYLQTEQALYGRYWGCDEEIDCLHFELAYYAGIEHCIGRGLPLFEAGAQGEHKLLRGFAPAPTYSSHWIRHAGLRDAVRRSLEAERASLPRYLEELRGFMPYKRQR